MMKVRIKSFEDACKSAKMVGREKDVYSFSCFGIDKCWEYWGKTVNGCVDKSDSCLLCYICYGCFVPEYCVEEVFD